MSPCQQIDCEVTFIGQRPPGHQISWPKNLNGRVYRPLFKVADEYFGVLVDSGPENPELDAAITISVTLMHPEVSSAALLPEVAFEIYEGSINVGFGKVLRRCEPKEALA